MSGALVPAAPDQFSALVADNPLLRVDAQPVQGPATGIAPTNTTNPAWVRKGKRAIGAIFPDVTIEEQHTDRLQVTQHPVAVGSPVNDHAFRLPAELTMRCGWSGTTDTRPRDVYQSLRKLQGTPEGEEVQLFDITTGKRDYTNMVLTEVTVRTEQATENVLVADLHFQEIILVQISTTTQPATTDMLHPGSTEDTKDAPAKQATPKPEDQTDLLSKITGGEAKHYQTPPPGGRLPATPPLENQIDT